MIIKTEIPIIGINNMKINTTKLQKINCNVFSRREIKYIVLHYTGNPKDTAKGNASYFKSGKRGASAHYFVDEDSIYQSVAIKDVAWHCGTNKTYYHADCRNVNSIGIEMCCSGNYKVSAKTQENTVRLVVKLCKVLGIDLKDVDKYILRHYDVTHKSCPAQWADDDSEFITFKNKVKSLLSGVSTSPSISTSKTFKVGDTVKIISGAKYTNGKLIPKWITEKTLYIRQIKGNNAVISTLKTGVVTGVVNLDYLVKDKVTSDSISSYRIRVITDKLNIRKGAGTNYSIIGTITDKGVYTIIEEATGQGATSWLKLKSGGYISADYVKKI